MQKKKFNLSGSIAFVLAILVLLIFVPFNLIANYYEKVIDMTPTGQYTLSAKAAKVLEETGDQPIEVFFLDDPIVFEKYPDSLPLYHTLTELEKRDNITLTYFDPNEDVELAKSLDPDDILGIKADDVFIRANNTVKRIPYAKVLVKNENGMIEYAGEEVIMSAIHLCVSGNLPKVYFLSGYTDKGIDNVYSGYADAIASDNYDVQSLDLSSFDAVPDDAAIVYLAGPEKDISAADRQKLSDYIDNGGSVSFILPPCETNGRFENIEFLLAKFELAMDYNQISESNKSYQYRDQEQNQSADYFKVTYPMPSGEQSEDLTTELNTAIAGGTTMDSSMVGISHCRSFSALASSSELIEKNSIIENLPTSQDSGEYTVISTPMGGDEETAKEAEALNNSPVILGWYSYNKQNGSKLILVGSDDIITDQDVSPNTIASRTLVLFSNTWLYDSDVDMGIGNKSTSYDTIHFEDAKQATFALNAFFVIPALLALCGVAVWLKRRFA
ncbi:MAG: Gldg family protein [Ruminococcus sp.]|nr:Gldg family protein [Ruminococcus sp.]